jgi:hypothetical protein
MALGQSFGRTPAGLEEQAQQAKKRVPTQQALQTLSLQMPKTLGGAEGLAPSGSVTGAYSPGGKFSGGVPDSSAAQMQRLVRAMTGFKPGAARPAPPRFTQSESARTPPPQAAAVPPTRAAAPPVVAKPVVPTVVKKPTRAPGSGGSRSKPTVPINPSVVGGGLVDQTVSPPPTQAPANDWANSGAESNTSQSGVYGTGASGGYNSSGQTGYYDANGTFITSGTRPYGR